MKKLINTLVLCLTVFLSSIFVTDVYAATASIKLKANKSTVVVGDKVKVTVTLSSSKALGSWDFTINYNSSYLSYVSSNMEGGNQAVNASTNSTTKSKTYTITFKAKKAGSSTISINGVKDVYAFDESKMTISNNSVNVKAITKEEYESSLSKDNYLKSLTVDGYTLTPNFNKDTTNYSLTVPNDVRNINVKATKNDSHASVSGAGNIKLQEGNNKVNIVVTAQNGNKRTYTINVTVKELNPINVKVDDKEYTVVRNKDNIESPNNTYTETTTLINGEDVPAFHSDITDYTLVGLTDKDGNVALYIYKDDNYTLYKEYKFSGIIIYFIEPKKIPFSKYDKKSIKIEEEKISSYQVGNINYPLVYGVNIETGKENWYTYDSDEGTLQRYVTATKDVKNKSEDDSKYKNLSIVLGSVSGILILFMMVASIKLSIKKKQEVN